MNAGMLAAALVVGVLVLLSVPASLQSDPASALHDQSLLPALFPDATLLFGGLPTLPVGASLLVHAPDVAFSDREVAAVRDVLTQGGRVAIVDDIGSGRGLLARLATDLELTGDHIFTPIRNDEAPILSGTGAWQGRQVVLADPVVVLGVEALLVSSELAWLDRNDNDRPDLTEPRGAWPVAAASGGLLVVGTGQVDADATLVALIREWLGPAPYIDESHRRTIDPMGAAPLLAGFQAGWLPVAVPVAAALGLLLALRFRIRRRVARARPIHEDPLTSELAP